MLYVSQIANLQNLEIHDMITNQEKKNNEIYIQRQITNYNNNSRAFLTSTFDIHL